MLCESMELCDYWMHQTLQSNITAITSTPEESEFIEPHLNPQNFKQNSWQIMGCRLKEWPKCSKIQLTSCHRYFLFHFPINLHGFLGVIVKIFYKIKVSDSIPAKSHACGSKTLIKNRQIFPWQLNLIFRKGAKCWLFANFITSH